MEAILRDDRVRSVARTLVRAVAITITFAVLYWAISAANPMLAKSLTEPFGLTFRWANALRAFMLPFGAPAVVGTSFGAQAFNVSTGTVGLFGQAFMPVITMLIGLLMLTWSKVWGRSTLKDLTVLTVYGALVGLVVAARHAGIALTVAPEAYRPLLEVAVLTRVGVTTLTHVAGYPLVRLWEAYRGKGGTAQ